MRTVFSMKQMLAFGLLNIEAIDVLHKMNTRLRQEVDSLIENVFPTGVSNKINRPSCLILDFFH